MEKWREQYWDALLRPISEEQPCGQSLRYEGDYDAILEARREDPDLPQGEWETELKKADWKQAEKLCLDALIHRSKDLQIAAWLLEALFHRYQFTGLAQGLHLIDTLCETYWDCLWPELEEDDFDLRNAPFTWINEKLPVALGYTAPITAPKDPDEPAYNFVDLQQSLQTGTEENNEELSYPQFMKSVMQTPLDFFIQLNGVLETCLSIIERLNTRLDETCGRQAPSLSRFRSRLADILAAIKNILREKPGGESALRDKHQTAIEEDEAMANGAEASDSDSRASGPDMDSGPIRSRREAYQRLDEVADYLLQTEPHSPTPYLVKRAVSWGDLSLNELLQELVNDEHDLRAIYILLGMRNRNE